MAERLLAAALVVPFAVGWWVAPDRGGEVAFAFRDPEVVESSGLAVVAGSVLTVNDSGDSARVFVVDPATGRTTRTITWSAEVDDVEGLAAGPDGAVLVGDIGDNARERSGVRVWRVPLDGSAATAYDLTYPDGAHDAESLLVEPGTGRVLVATKEVFGGTLYAAPVRLRAGATHRLEPVGSVLPIATDGTFLPDGRHLALRDYGRVVVYSWPGLDVVGAADLPEQDQGEGIAAAADGTAYVSSEGQFSEVLRVELPVPATTVPAEPSTTPAPDPGGSPESGPESPPTRAAWPWLLGGVVGVVLVAVLVRSLRPR